MDDWPAHYRALPVLPMEIAVQVNEMVTAAIAAERERLLSTDGIAVNLMRFAGLDKHKARECEAIVRQVLAAGKV